MPELVSTICTFLVLAPLVLTPGLGQFLFKPMAMAVAFSMIAAYILSRTLVPTCSAFWLKGHGNGHGGGHGEPAPANSPPEIFTINGNGGAHRGGLFGPIKRAFQRWEQIIETGIGYYVRSLDFVLRHRLVVILVGYGMFAATTALMWPINSPFSLRRDFFPEVDAGSFEMYVRAPSGTRIEVTEQRIKDVEDFVKETIEEEDLLLILSELGVTADWSAAYTPNSGPMDAVVKIQLSAERHHSAQEYVHMLRTALNSNPKFNKDLEFAFDAGGMVRAAMNEGKSTPISIRVTGKNQNVAHKIATAIRNEVAKIDGVVDPRVIQRINYPQYVITVDRLKAADLGLTQGDVMENVVAAFNSSISFNKHNFWIDPVSKNQYFVGVQYWEKDIKSIETLLDIPVTTQRPDVPKRPIPLRNVVQLRRETVPSEVTHYQIQPTIEVSLGVYGRDLGHVSVDVSNVLGNFGKVDEKESGTWRPYDPSSQEKRLLTGSKIVLSGEYLRMQDTFDSLFKGIGLAMLLIYFLMVGLDKSFVVPLSVMSILPLCLIGILPMLYLTGSAVNVQSLLGFIFIIGIKVANTVLMTDYAQELRRHEGLTPTEAIRKAAGLRVRPITMTALAAFFALIPGAMALERGSESNAPLARAILGGLLAGEPATLFVLPAIYSLIVRESAKDVAERLRRQHSGGHGNGQEGTSLPEGAAGSPRLPSRGECLATTGRAGSSIPSLASLRGNRRSRTGPVPAIMRDRIDRTLTTEVSMAIGLESRVEAIVIGDAQISRNAAPARLYELAVATEGASILSSGALATFSGEKTGRSPKDCCIVRSPGAAAEVWWGPVNIPAAESSFQACRRQALEFLVRCSSRVYVVDGYAGWDPEYRVKVRVLCARADHALFMHDLLIRPTPEELETFGEPDLTIVNAGGRAADPLIPGVSSRTSVMLHLDRGEMIILGTNYAGEMKKGVFTAMNFGMPRRGVLSMHCSANQGDDGDVSLFFGLSGTGKTTLSSDPGRRLIGDDEHAWSDRGIFNIEGGCYAKCIGLRESQEPQIHRRFHPLRRPSWRTWSSTPRRASPITTIARSPRIPGRAIRSNTSTGRRSPAWAAMPATSSS